MTDDEFQIWAAAFVRALPLDRAGQQAYDAVDRYCSYIKEYGPVRGEPDHAAVARSLWNTSIEARINYLAGMAAKQHAVIEAAREWRHGSGLDWDDEPEPGFRTHESGG